MDFIKGAMGGLKSLTGGGSLAFGDASSRSDGFFETGAFDGGSINTGDQSKALLIVAAAAGLALVLWKR
jgi:hypothetical protein